MVTGTMTTRKIGVLMDTTIIVAMVLKIWIFHNRKFRGSLSSMTSISLENLEQKMVLKFTKYLEKNIIMKQIY
jgi:hypothetical protein